MKLGARQRVQGLRDLVVAALADLNGDNEANAAAKLIQVQNRLPDVIKFVQLFAEEVENGRTD